MSRPTASEILKKIGADTEGKILLYKYIDYSGALKLLENRTFKFSKVEEFNDPFDLYDSLLDFTKFEPITFKYSSRKERRNVENASLKKRVFALKKTWAEYKSYFGITCLSKNRDNILMWSHYADKHEGACIGIEIDLLKLINDGFLTFPVIYENDFVPLPYLDKDMDNRFEVISKYMSTKAKFWKYEEEVRIINTNYYKQFKSPFFLFDKYATVKECLLGLKMEKANKLVMKKKAKQFNIELFEMSNQKKKFALKEEKVK